MPPEPAIAALLLAAGLSQRMRGPNKLLLEIDGEPMIRRTARTVLASRAQSVLVVLGHQADKVRAALAGLPVAFTDNDLFAEGQMSSVRQGLADAPDADGYLIVLGDQPFLTSADIDRLVEVFGATPRGKILVPSYQSQRGNPILIPADAREEIAAGDVKFGCKNLIRNNPERVLAVPFDTHGVIADIDTPETYAALSRAHAQTP